MLKILYKIHIPQHKYMQHAARESVWQNFLVLADLVVKAVNPGRAKNRRPRIAGFARGTPGLKISESDERDKFAVNFRLFYEFRLK